MSHMTDMVVMISDSFECYNGEQYMSFGLLVVHAVHLHLSTDE